MTMKTTCCKGLDAVLNQPTVVGGRAPYRKSVLGFDAGKTYLVMHIENPEGLVAHEKGSGTAWAAMTLVPEYVTNTIYQTVADQMKQQFKEKGSDVSIDIVQTPPTGSKPVSDLKTGVFFGALLAAACYGAVKLVVKGAKIAGK